MRKDQFLMSPDSQAATLASLASFALALPEAGRAWRALTR
jgi:hypothetical protein